MTSKTKLKIDKQKYNLIDLENIIEEGKKTILKTFFDIGKSLFIIRECDLFQKFYGTFQNYCLEKWDISDRQARNLINAYNVLSNLQDFIDNSEGGTIVPKILPLTETQCRPLSRIKNIEDQIKVLDSVHGKINNPNNTVPLSLTEKLITETSIELNFLKEPVQKEKDLISSYQSQIYDKLKELKKGDSVDKIKSLQEQVNTIFSELINTFEKQEPEPRPEIVIENEQSFEELENEFLEYMEESRKIFRLKDVDTRGLNRRDKTNSRRNGWFNDICSRLSEKIKEPFEKSFKAGYWSTVTNYDFQIILQKNSNKNSSNLSVMSYRESLLRDLYDLLKRANSTETE